MIILAIVILLVLLTSANVLVIVYNRLKPDCAKDGFANKLLELNNVVVRKPSEDNKQQGSYVVEPNRITEQMQDDMAEADLTTDKTALLKREDLKFINKELNQLYGNNSIQELGGTKKGVSAFNKGKLATFEIEMEGLNATNQLKKKTTNANYEAFRAQSDGYKERRPNDW